MDPVVDPWSDRETCYNSIAVPESYSGPRLSFPLSLSDTNALLSAFKEQQVQNMGLSIVLPLSFNCLVYVLGCSLRFFHTDSPCQICSAAAVRDQKAPQTDAQHHPLVNILHKRDHYMWWVTMTAVSPLILRFKIVFYSTHVQRRTKKLKYFLF